MGIGCLLFFFKQKTAYEMRSSDWSSDVCSSDLIDRCRTIIGLEWFSRVSTFTIYLYRTDEDEPFYAILCSPSGQTEGACHIDFAKFCKDILSGFVQIGRASCWESVCQ